MVPPEMQRVRRGLQGEVQGREEGEVTDERVVRCRDCEHSRKDGTMCMYFAAWYPIAGGDEYEEIPAEVEPDGFCKWAKLRDKEQA